MASEFQPFDPRRGFHSTHRNLPHWSLAGATYFVTFRLADALPAEVRTRLEEMRQLNDADAFNWIERYLDAGSGDCTLSLNAHAMIVATALRHFDNKRYALGAYVVMPNHVHALVQPFESFTLTSLVHSWKSYTAHKLQRHAGSRGRVWQEESFDRIVRNEEELIKSHEYILANPAAAHLRPGTFLVGEGSANWLRRQS